LVSATILRIGSAVDAVDGLAKIYSSRGARSIATGSLDLLPVNVWGKNTFFKSYVELI
jgi:hypothetical protein